MPNSNASVIMKNEIISWYNNHPNFQNESHAKALYQAAQSGNIVEMQAAQTKYNDYANGHAYKPDGSSSAYNYPEFTFTSEATKAYTSTITSQNGASEQMKNEIIAWYNNHPNFQDESHAKALYQAAQSGNIVEMQGAQAKYNDYADNHAYKPDGSSSAYNYPEFSFTADAVSAYEDTVTGKNNVAVALDTDAYGKYADAMNDKIVADKAKAILGDTNSDGKLSKDEVLTQFDKNKDGKITKQELGVALTSPQVQTGEHGVKTIAGITITDQGALDKAAFTAKTANWTQKQWDDWKNFVNLAKQNEASVERTGEQSAAWKNFSGNVDTINKMKALGNKGSDADLLATAGQMNSAQKQELNKVFQDKQGGEFKNEFSGIDPRIGQVLNSSTTQDVKNKAIAQINSGNTSSADNLIAFFGGKPATTPAPATASATNEFSGIDPRIGEILNMTGVSQSVKNSAIAEVNKKNTSSAEDLVNWFKGSTPAATTQSDPNFDPALKHPTLNPTGSVQVDKNLKALFASASKPAVASGGNPHETPATTYTPAVTPKFTQEPRPSATIGKMVAM